MDGLGCVIVGKYAYGDNLDYTICDYHDVNEKIMDELFNKDGHFKGGSYDLILITDISVNEEVAEKLESEINQSPVKTVIQLLDHHPTAEWLNKYSWASVIINHQTAPEVIKASGTSMLYYWLMSQGIDVSKCEDLVEKIRRYDTWQWSTKYNDTHAKQLNDLLYIIGRDKFVKRFVDNPDPKLTESEQLILDLEQEKIDRYIESKEKQITEAKYTDGHTGVQYQFGVVFAEQYHSQLGNILATNHPEYDFIAIINPGSNKVSYRSVKDDINGNVSLFAQLFGGGGHVKASGSQYDEELNKRFIDMIFD